MPGKIAKNAQEGTRSEYLAQYALSSFGTSIPVPHPEDSGIDLYCTFGHRVGKLFLVNNYYLVQVKSNTDIIEYNDKDEVSWLLSHKYPLLICVVTKKSAQIQLFQTVAVSTLIAKENIKKITLHPKTKPNNNKDYFSSLEQEDDVDIFLGDPIAKFSVTNLADDSFKIEISNTLMSWIELDQENIDLKATGYTMYRIPETWNINEPVKALKFIGNFKDSLTNITIRRKFDDLFFKLLSQLVNQAAAEGDIKKYIPFTRFIEKYTKNNKISDSFGIKILQFCINEGNKHLGIDKRLYISQSLTNDKI